MKESVRKKTVNENRRKAVKEGGTLLSALTESSGMEDLLRGSFLLLRFTNILNLFMCIYSSLEFSLCIKMYVVVSRMLITRSFMSHIMWFKCKYWQLAVWFGGRDVELKDASACRPLHCICPWATHNNEAFHSLCSPISAPSPLDTHTPSTP